MSGYLERYGAGEDRRENLIRNSIILTLAVVVLGSLAVYVFHTHHQISVTNRFLGFLRAKNYPAAYAAWGCGGGNPCKEYPYSRFMEDWGPASASGGSPILKVTDSEGCGTGVILTVDVSPGNTQKLFIDKNNDALSFSPVPTCRGKSAWTIMAHRTIGRMRRIFF